MPKPLSPEQLEALQANGVVIPGYGSPEASSAEPNMPAGLIERTLGSTGLPHTVSVERLGDEPEASTGSLGSLESLGAPGLEASYRASHNAASNIMNLMGETIPDVSNPNLLHQLELLKPTFELFAASGFAPEIVLRPTNRDLTFWGNLAQTVQNSPLNPNKPGSNEKVLQNGGLYIDSAVKSEWTSITNPSGHASTWGLEVMSTLDRPAITSITGYGYTDGKNEYPHDALNDLLKALHKPEMQERIGRKGQKLLLEQPNIHPSPDSYLMHQLTRIIQQQPPLDGATWSWLKGTLKSGGVLAGWGPGVGRFSLNWRGAGDVGGNFGVRPSGRG